MEKYGQPEPPAYDLTKTVVPVALFHAENDWLSSMEVCLRTFYIDYSGGVLNFCFNEWRRVEGRGFARINEGRRTRDTKFVFEVPV